MMYNAKIETTQRGPKLYLFVLTIRQMNGRRNHEGTTRIFLKRINMYNDLLNYCLCMKAAKI